MSHIFHPFHSKQDELRTQLKATQEQLGSAQQRYMNAEHLLEAELAAHVMAEQALSGVQENLKSCIDYGKIMQAEMENLKARNADLEDEVARLKHKKLPNRTRATS